jgi:putative ABC transport system ATP-binding protein
MRSVSIEAVSITKAFTSGQVHTWVIRELTLAIAPGRLTLISGPSGCGKSTLLALLSGLLRPDTGRVNCLGVGLHECSPTELERFRLRHSGFVFQGFNLFPALSALEQVMLPLKYLRIGARESRRRAYEALDEVGLAARAAALPSELSGGEKQRVAIARALAKRPVLLFADEPTSALDRANGQTVIELLKRIAHKHQATVVCASHDPRLAAQSDATLRMEDGRLQGDVVADTSTVTRQLRQAPYP